MCISSSHRSRPKDASCKENDLCRVILRTLKIRLSNCGSGTTGYIEIFIINNIKKEGSVGVEEVPVEIQGSL